MTSPDGSAASAAPVRLLLIEDSPSDAMLLETALRESMLRSAVIEHESSLAAALKRLTESEYDAVLLDLGLPDSDGLPTFKAVAAAARRAAVVVVTGLEDANLGQEAVRLGAQDVLTKGERRRGEVGRAVDYAIRRQRLNDELERARQQQLDAKDRFLNHVSHELRSPLSVVHQFGSLLLDGLGGTLSVDQQDLLNTLMGNLQQLRVMIDDLLDSARVQRGQVSLNCHDVDLRALIAETVTAYQPNAELRRITLGFEGRDLPTVLADPDRIREVLTNLLDNALRFTPALGRITVEAVAASGKVQVTVRDTGRGIAPEDQPRIFDQFYRVSGGDHGGHNGLGLGLFVSRELVERQAGEMWVESTLGRGTALSFTLPVPVSATDPSPDPARRAATSA